MFKNTKIQVVSAKKRPNLGEEKCVRTVSHVYHFPDLPCGEITIEGFGLSKHCTIQDTIQDTATQRKVNG